MLTNDVSYRGLADDASYRRLTDDASYRDASDDDSYTDTPIPTRMINEIRTEIRMGHAVLKVVAHTALVEIALERFDDTRTFTGSKTESIYISAEEAWRLAFSIKRLLAHEFDAFIQAKPWARAGFNGPTPESSSHSITIKPMADEISRLQAAATGKHVTWAPDRRVAAIHTNTPTLDGGTIEHITVCSEKALASIANRLINASRESDIEAERNGFPSTYSEALESIRNGE